MSAPGGQGGSGSGQLYSGQDKKMSSVKKTVDLAGATRRRQDQSLSLRQKERERTLKEMRTEGAAGMRTLASGQTPSVAPGREGPDQTIPANPMDPFAYHARHDPHIIPVALLPDFARMILDETSPLDVKLHGTMMIRKLLSVDDNPPIVEVVDACVVPALVNFLTIDELPSIQFESAWALTNIASGTPEDAELVMRSNITPNILRILNSPNESVREQSAWALGNLAGENIEYRDYILQEGALQPLLECIHHCLDNPHVKATILRNSVWALSNLCRGRPAVEIEIVQPALMTLAHLLNHHDDEVVVDAAWALSYVSDGSPERAQILLDLAVVPKVVQLLSNPSPALQTPAVRVIGNLAAGSEQQTDIVVNCGALHAFHFLLMHSRRVIRKEACWTMSNITAGTVTQIQAIIRDKLFPVLMKCMYCTEFEVKKEAVWAVANATSGATKEQIRYLVEIKVLDALCDMLCLHDVKTVLISLEAIENILFVGEEDRQARNLPKNLIVQLLYETGNFQKLEVLQTHGNHDIYHQAMAVLDRFFDIEELSAGQRSGEVGAGAFDYSSGGAGGGQYSL